MDRGDCDGPLDPAHLIPKQVLKRKGLDNADIWDSRIIMPMCRRHHHQFDNHFINLERWEIPSTAEDYAAEHHLQWELEKRYGVY